MVACEFRNGSDIERVLAEGIEVLISAEKLRGTDLWFGEIDATPWRHTTILRVLFG